MTHRTYSPSKFGRLALLLAPLLVLVSYSGCGGQGKSGSGAKTTPMNVEAKRLEFDENVSYPPLDNGKLHIQRPVDWKDASSKGGNLVVIVMSGKSYPIMMIPKPEDASIAELNAETKTQFLADETAAISYVVQKPRVLEIDGRTWIGFSTTQKTQSGETLEATTLETVAGGRKYKVISRSLSGQANADWPALLTMAAGMSFGDKPAAPADPQPDTETKPADSAPVEKSE